MKVSLIVTNDLWLAKLECPKCHEQFGCVVEKVKDILAEFPDSIDYITGMLAEQQCIQCGYQKKKKNK